MSVPALHPQFPQHGRITQTSGAAITSMILGILSVAACLLPLGLVAVIFGHVSLGRIAKSGGQLTGRGMAIAGLVLGYVGTVILVAYVGFVVVAIRESNQEAGKPDDLFPRPELSSVTFPELGEGVPIEDTGVKVYDLQTSGEGPAGSTRLRVLVPAGEHVDGSLPCVLIAPAGSDLLSGMDLDAGDYFDETLPYAEAGMVVVSYSIDGPAGENETESFNVFKAAGAGVANASVALEFATKRLPMVDASKIFSAGHSSAGALSLLLAAHMPELAGSIAYAPPCDLEEHMKKVLEFPFSSLSYPNLKTFAKRSSPLTHAARIKVPVFLFGARDDDKVTSEEWRNFARVVEDAGGAAEVETVAEGGHYQSMIDAGIPAGIEWIRARL